MSKLPVLVLLASFLLPARTLLVISIDGSPATDQGKEVGAAPDRRPIFAGGNVGNAGDIAMMEYSKGCTGPSFQLLINHDDEAREFAYAEKDNLSLDAAKKNGSTVVNIKTDWKTVFVAGRAAVAR